MASDDTKNKTAAAAPPAAAKSESTASEGSSKAEGDSSSGKNAAYNRDERQKPISVAYRDNWTAIFGKKKKR